MKGIVRVFMLGIAVLVYAFTSCSLQDDGPVFSSRDLEHPDMVMYDADYLLGMAKRQPIFIHAEIIELYQDGLALLESIEFIQKAQDGSISITGSADFGKINTDTNDAKLTGRVIVSNIADDIRVEAEELNWNHAERLLSCPLDKAATVNYSDHYTITGYGFTGDFTSATFEFARVEQGVVLDVE